MKRIQKKKQVKHLDGFGIKVKEVWIPKIDEDQDTDCVDSAKGSS